MTILPGIGPECTCPCAHGSSETEVHDQLYRAEGGRSPKAIS